MKKLMMALAFVGLGSMTAMAQNTEVPTNKYSVATNSFWANWFVSAGVQSIGSYTSQENCCNVNPFSVDRTTIGGNIAIGKWFTPEIALRTKAEAMHVKNVISRDDHKTYKFFNIHEDVMFNLSNIICGYNANRVWNFIPYVGLGWGQNTDTKNNELTYNFGIINNFRVGKRVSLFAEVGVSMFEGSFDGATPDNWANHGKFWCRYWDKQVNVSAGITYDISKTNTWNAVPDVDALMAMNQEQMDALNQSLKEQQDENARLRDMLAAEQNKPVVESEAKTAFVGTSASVFFNINSDQIASRKDLVNVKELAEYAKANNAKVVVAGYADSKTGSAAYNQALSEKRANVVADELVKMGMDRDNIVIEAKGGVNNLSPFSYNRRATVKVQ